MPTTLSADQFNLLPLHDAEVLSWALEHDADKNLVVRLRVEINPEESLDSFAELGIRSRRVELAFCCRNGDLQFHGNSMPPDILLDYVATSGTDCRVTLGCASGTKFEASKSGIRISPID